MQPLARCDYFRTSVVFQDLDTYNIVGEICNLGIKKYFRLPENICNNLEIFLIAVTQNLQVLHISFANPKLDKMRVVQVIFLIRITDN